MLMHFEEGDYATRFVSETENCDVVVLNQFNYNDKNEDNSKSFLMNRLLEVYYGSEADFPKGEIEKLDVSESYENFEYMAKNSAINNSKEFATDDVIEQDIQYYYDIETEKKSLVIFTT